MAGADRNTEQNIKQDTEQNTEQNSDSNAKTEYNPLQRTPAKFTTTIYLTRHGQTFWNNLGLCQGQADIALSENGLRQAHLLAERLQSCNIAAVYSSDLQRARVTAEIVAARHNLPVQILPELRETCFGDWEGMSFDNMALLYPELYAVWIKKPLTTRCPNGETMQEVRERCCPVLRRLAEKHRGQEIVIVAHGGNNRVMLCDVLGLDFARRNHLCQDNTAVNILDYYNGSFSLVLMNSTYHLASGS